MVTEKDIRQYIGALSSKTQKDDSSFLLKIGKFLRTASRDELSASVIFQIESLITKMHRKYEAKKIIKELQDLLDEIKVSAFDLGNKAQNDQIDKSFFREILNLGNMLIQVSGILKVIALPIILSTAEHAETIQKLLEDFQRLN